MFEKFKKRRRDGADKERDMYVQSVLATNKLPIVILDNSWYAIKPFVQTPNLLKKEQFLLEYLKEQGTLTNKLKEDQVVKQNLMREVLYASQQLNEIGDESKLKELDKLQQGILKLNDELGKAEERLERLEEFIDITNREILEEAVAIGYEQMEECRGMSQKLEKEIDDLRASVVQKVEEKKKYDEGANNLYQYLHNIVGYKGIDKVDKVLKNVEGAGDKK